MRATLTNDYTKIIETVAVTTIQNVGTSIINVAVLSTDVKPTTDTGFILESKDSIKIPASKFVYCKSNGTSGLVEVV